jgi:hypothetical protein
MEAPSQSQNPFGFKIYVSYHKQDSEMVNRYCSALIERGFQIMIDENILHGGDNYREVLYKAQQDADGTIVFLTPESVYSENVKYEISNALNYARNEKEGKFLIPLVMPGVRVPDALKEITYIQIDKEPDPGTIENIDKSIRSFMESKRPSPDQNIRQEKGASESEPLETESLGPQYWLIKMNDNTWNIDGLQPGGMAYFNSYEDIERQRPDYEQFQKIKKDDLVLGHAYGSLNALVCRFTVSLPLHEDKVLGEIVTFQVESLLNPNIPVSSFQEKLGLTDRLNPDSRFKLIPLTPDEYNIILQGAEINVTSTEPEKEFKEYYNQFALSGLNTDSPAAELPDELDFTSDIEAMASIIAYREINPPLAIGLFGNWGTGKSFFMNKLQKRIQELAESPSPEYCDHVIPINFNSWHYSDSNLWASLITKIFEDLEKYSRDHQDEGKLDVLLKNLNSTRELQQEKEKEKVMLEKEIELLNEKKDQLDKQIEDNVKNLNKVRLIDIIKAVWQDPKVQQDVKSLSVEFKTEQIKDYQQIENDIKTLGNGFSRFIKCLKLVYLMKGGKKWQAALLALAIFGAFFGVAYLMQSEWGWWKEVKYYISAAAVIISQAVIYLKPAFNKLDNFYDRLLSLKQTIDELENSQRKEQSMQLDSLTQNLENVKSAHFEVSEKIGKLEIEKELIITEIEDIASGRKIIHFIEGRVTEQRYVNSLGIISWVRKDFEELDFLLKQQYNAKKLDELKRKPVPEVYQIDRIVLYIDDLDRCEVDTVVRVLEAIHLLLAFPLFVVVVGVDPRWMHNALTIKYDKFLHNKKKPAPGEPKAANKNDEEDEEEEGIIDHPATSYDYLEKIFQIPFVLKPMDDTGKRKMIQSQLEGKKSDDAVGKAIPASPAAPTDQPADQPAVVPVGQPGTPTPGSSSVPAETADISQQQVTAEKAEEEAKKEKARADTIRLLEVKNEEIEFMKSISFLIGESPRTIKRYVNIYRIIHSHAKFRFIDKKENEHYMAAMILLGIITGTPQLSKSFFEMLKQEKSDKKQFSTFLDAYLKQSKKQNPLLSQMYSDMSKDKPLYGAGKMNLKKFKANIDLISRFSFRNLAY